MITIGSRVSESGRAGSVERVMRRCGVALAAVRFDDGRRTIRPVSVLRELPAPASGGLFGEEVTR